MSSYDTLVIGAGLAGLTTANQLVQAGQKVLLIATGAGALLLASGCIDVLGFQPPDSGKPVKNPLDCVTNFLQDRPADHPYQQIGLGHIEAGLQAFLDLTEQAGLAYQGNAAKNWWLPSPAGAVHPTCLAPTSLANGELSQGGTMLIVGFPQLRDFYPALISQNLNAQVLGVTTTSAAVELPPIPAADQMNVTPIELALAFEQTEFRQRVVQRLKPKIKNVDRIGFPAVLGLNRHHEVLGDLEEKLGKTVFEISTLPPSVPGRRLFERLRHLFVHHNGRLILGSKVVDGTIERQQVTRVHFETANRLRSIQAKNYVLATGGIYGGGLCTDAEGGLGRVWEPIFNLPIEANPNRHHWFAAKFLAPTGQPFARFGLKVNDKLNPINAGGEPLATNLYVAGATLAGTDWTQGRTGEGVALASAGKIAQQIIDGA